MSENALLFKEGDYFKNFRQNEVIIRGRLLIDGRLLFEGMWYTAFLSSYSFLMGLGHTSCYLYLRLYLANGTVFSSLLQQMEAKGWTWIT